MADESKPPGSGPPHNKPATQSPQNAPQNAPQNEADLEIFRRMVKMNPTMRAPGLDTTQAAGELREAMKQAKAQAQPKAATGASPAPKPATRPGMSTQPPSAPPSQVATAAGALRPAVKTSAVVATDLVSAVTALEQRFVVENKNALAQIELFEAQLKELPKKVLERIVATMVKNDPQLRSPKTQHILKLKKEFLDAIGFSTALVEKARGPAR